MFIGLIVVENVLFLRQNGLFSKRKSQKISNCKVMKEE